MSTAEQIRRRADVKHEDIDDVVALAESLQEEARRAAQGASKAEVQAAAAELDVAPEFVEAAIGKLQHDREEAARAAAAATEKARIQRATRLRWGAGSLAGAVVLAGLLGVSGAGAVRARAEEAATAKAGLDAVLQRQASLAPQLVAMAGGRAGDLEGPVQAMTQATTVQAKLDAATTLGTAMATALASLPEGAAGDREALRYDIVGTNNRITVEQRRWAEAEAGWRAAAGTISGRVAVTLGLAEGP